MKMSFRRPWVLLLAVLLFVATAASTLTGCGSSEKPSDKVDTNTPDQTSEAGDSGNSGDSAEAEGPKVYPQFSIWLGFEKMSPEVTKVQEIFKEKLGFDFKVQSIHGDLMTALNLKLNSGGFEDVAVIYKDDKVINAIVKSGTVQEVSQYLQMPDKYPHLANIPQKVIDYSKSSDGNLWYIPTWYAQEMDDPWPGWAASAWWYREDVLQKVGMTVDDLATLEGFEKYLTEAAKLTDDSGKPLIPMGFCINEGNVLNGEENVIISAFGLNIGSMVQEEDGKLVFHYDNPKLKDAFKWLNNMYRKGLLDVEVTTQKPERYREKIKAGRYAALAGSIWKAELNNFWTQLDGPTSPVWYIKPTKVPTVPGVATAPIQYANPYPGACVFISKNTKNIDSILNFMNWALEPDPIRQQEINEGPVGVNWFWTGEPLGEWDFEPSYAAERNSGDQARVDACTPQLWMMSTYSKKWYPWWTNRISEDSPEGMKFTNKYTSEIANNFGLVRVIHSYDLVTPPAGGVIEKYKPTLDAVYIEYRARMIMAKSDAEFENEYNNFIKQIETRAHWSEIKEEWTREYQKYIAEHGEF